jgi:hypothetical protein
VSTSFRTEEERRRALGLWDKTLEDYVLADDLTVEGLIGLLKTMPQDLRVFVTNGDLDPVPVGGVSVQPADYGQLVLVSR